MNYKSIVYIAGFISFLLFSQTANAAGGSIYVEPISGQFKSGEELSVVVSVDGGGIPFNAAKAEIYPSPNFKVEDLTLGDCNFAFVTTPTKASLSFAGVILGDSKDRCNVYSMTLRAISPGNGNVLISDGSIKAYQGAYELISRMNGGTYSVLGQSIAEKNSVLDETPTVSSDGKNLYNISYTVRLEKEALDVKAYLDKGSDKEKTLVIGKLSNDSEHTVRFVDVEQGVHMLTIESGGQLLKSRVITAGGEIQEMAFGQVVGDVSKRQFLLYASIIISITAVLVGSAIVYMIWNRMKSSVY